MYRDATIVTTLDTFTSLLAGVTIFGILGHLAHEVGTDNIGDVVNPGAGLAFISYPDAIARFQFMPQVNFGLFFVNKCVACDQRHSTMFFCPQVFSVLFFFMLFVLGIGSNIAMCSCIITAIRDQFPSVKASQAALGVASAGFLIGLVYITPVIMSIHRYDTQFDSDLNFFFRLSFHCAGRTIHVGFGRFLWCIVYCFYHEHCRNGGSLLDLWYTRATIPMKNKNHIELII